MLCTIIDFLSFREQQVVLNGKVSTWTNIEARVPQGFIRGSLLILIYVIDLSDDLATSAELFADHSSFFSVVCYFSDSFDNDLRKINKRAFQRKISFDPDPTKQAQEVIYSHKKASHPSIYFNNNPIKQVSSRKHLEMTIFGLEFHYLQHLNHLSGLSLIIEATQYNSALAITG